MKIEILQAALQHYLRTAESTAEQRDQAFKAMNECAATMERYDNHDTWQNEVTLLTDWSLDNILNELTYDIYGKLARIHNGNVPFMYYANACRKLEPFEHFIDEQLQTGYDIISNLWSDNEAEGSHGPDGTLIK